MTNFEVVALRGRQVLTQRRTDRAVDGLIVAFGVALFVIPSDVVFAPFGAAGSPASLLGLAMLLLAASRFLSSPRILLSRVPVPVGGAVLLLLASLLSYAFAQLAGRSLLQMNAADRWMLSLSSALGLMLAVAQSLNVRHTVSVSLAVVVLGGSYEGLVGILQWAAGVDLAALVRDYLPVLSVNGEVSAFAVRGTLARVTGTGLSPIELGTVAGMCLPTTLGLLLVRGGALNAWPAWITGGLALLTALALPASVARSGAISVLVGVAVLMLFLPGAVRLKVLLVMPFVVAVLISARPGYGPTLATFFAAGAQDPSINTRLQDYTIVFRSLAQHPVVGTGGGTFLPIDALSILDNQYLKSLLELGLLGGIALIAWFVVPLLAGISVAARSNNHARVRVGGLVGGISAAAVSAATFDAFSFPLYFGVNVLLSAGVVGMWKLQEEVMMGGSSES